MAVCKAIIALLFAVLASAFPCDESNHLNIPLTRPKARFGFKNAINVKLTIPERARQLSSQQQLSIQDNMVTFGDTTRTAGLPLPYHKTSSHTYTQPNATLQDLAHQLQRWQQASNPRPAAALLTIGAGDARLAAARAACSPSTHHSSCEAALHIAHARISGLSSSHGSLHHRLADGILSTVIRGRASGGTTFQVYVAGYDGAALAAGLTDVRAAGVRSVVGALNKALAESAHEVNQGLGAEVALFMPRDSDMGMHGRSRGAWARTDM